MIPEVQIARRDIVSTGAANSYRVMDYVLLQTRQSELISHSPLSYLHYTYLTLDAI